MVTGQSVSLFDGYLGSTVDSHRNCIDYRRRPLSVFQPVSHGSSHIIRAARLISKGSSPSSAHSPSLVRWAKSRLSIQLQEVNSIS